MDNTINLSSLMDKVTAPANRFLIIAEIVGVLMCVSIPVISYHIGFGKGKAQEHEAAYKLGYKDASAWFAEHPIIKTGDNCKIETNNYSTEKRGFQMCIWPIRLGW